MALTLNANGLEPLGLHVSRVVLHGLAHQWDLRMRNRNRWIENQQLRDSMGRLAREHLNGIGVSEAYLEGLARAEVVEVASESSAAAATRPGGGRFGWMGRVLSRFLESGSRRLPWEGLLTQAVRAFQNQERLLVYRRLTGLPPYLEAPRPASPLKALFVESAPGKMLSRYDFDHEYQAVKGYLNGVDLLRRQHPSLDELKAYIAVEKPALIHLSGVDGYDGFQILKRLAEESGSRAQTGTGTGTGTAEEQRKEGVYFRGPAGEPTLESPDDVAAALCPAGHRPLLVTLNLYNSSARLAATTVERGAAVAIGFQDFIDDTVAEIFFTSLFETWSRDATTPLLEAFRAAIKRLAPYSDKVRGSGVTLWTSEALLEADRARKQPLLPRPEDVGEGLTFPLPEERHEAAKGTGSGKAHIELDVVVRPHPTLNYSVLHNGKRQMFEIFRVYKFSPGERRDLRVEVSLNVGGVNFPFRGTFTMRDHILDLSDQIVVGLTSSLSRSLRESVRTTVFVRVTLGPDDERYCRTFDVSLLAVDEWIDDSRSGVFLPSFVLPRDPVIVRVIAAAHRYLMALADDVTQGFDGYQSSEDSAEDAAVALKPQARAIWYALQHDFALKYINPPPTFTESSQRLRTPSDVLQGGRGTCIDLALVLTACFEHIGLHPVIFLLRGHAFVGYWTSEQSRDDFRTLKVDLSEMPAGGPELVQWLTSRFVPDLNEGQEPLDAETAVPPVEWKFDVTRWKDIVAAVERGDLVALEATYLTNGGSFADAAEVGAENLGSEAEFDSMLDIALAREKGVTPLPVAAAEGNS